jgi:hypothetical protein
LTPDCDPPSDVSNVTPGLKFGVDLEDPEVEKAVTVIQAGYRGMEARKQVAQLKTERDAEEGSNCDRDAPAQLESV